MEALSRFPLSLPCLLPPHQSPSQTHFSNPIFSPKISSTTRKPPISSRETVAFAANPNDPKESVFMDENGAVDDMDGYLNHLSLEYDSVWDTKPSCSLLSSSTGREGFGSFLNTLVQYREVRGRGGEGWEVSHLLFYRCQSTFLCQPWTIMLTGVSAIACSWLILHSAVITSLVLSVISLWWYIFLYSYPKAYSDMIAERRKKVTSGVEDTFGLKKSQ
ncbi:hypothetical protein CK203_002622 [Vitis vinifera]|uniref:DUF6737 domain-containing protein n=1 Tax=Vitis vinifera TaxID=29760 RepID=A0A438KHP5_VITVI|nr:hypothetical protein CK203_002622 [Vitis vinifera]